MEEASFGIMLCLPCGRMGLGLKRLKGVWRGFLRPAVLLQVLGRSIPFLWTHFLNVHSWMDRMRGSNPDSSPRLTGIPCDVGTPGWSMHQGGVPSLCLLPSLLYCNSSHIDLPPTTLNRITPGPHATMHFILISYQQEQILFASTMFLEMDK